MNATDLTKMKRAAQAKLKTRGLTTEARDLIEQLIATADKLLALISQDGLESK